MAKRARASSSGETDESSPLFFLLIMLMVIVVPWTLVVISSLLSPGKQEVQNAFPKVTEDGKKVRHCQTQAMAAKREAQISVFRSRAAVFTRGFVFRLVVLLVLWVWLLYMVVQVRQVLATSTAYQNFDPSELLGLSSSAKRSDIKKAFHKLSLQWHPDKNQSPEAPAKFMMIKKAYDALTDPVAKRNYELYGNPDGPTRVTLGVALPSVSKEQQGVVLVLFVLLFVIGVPLTMLWCMSGGDANVGKNGVLQETMEALAQGVTPSTDLRESQSLLLASRESASVSNALRDAEEEEILTKLQSELRPKTGKAASQEPSKAELLFLAHVHRRHAELTGRLLEDLEAVLRKWRLVSLGMVEVAAAQNLANTRSAALTLHRCLVQALEPGAASSVPTALLQVPHLDAERIKQWRKGPRKAVDFRAFAEMASDERRSSLEAIGLGPQEILDVEEFGKGVPRMSVEATSVVVEGEENIYQNDIATLRVKLLRANLSEDEATGAAHTPHFSSAGVPEAWWVFLSLPGGKAARPCFVRMTDAGRQPVALLRFRVPVVGKCHCKLVLSCEAYLGLDFEHSFSFEAARGQERHDEHGKGGSGSEEDDE